MSVNRMLKALLAACVFVTPLLLASTALAAQEAACADADAGDNIHPSGEDRSCENGSLGGSRSDPDAMENGGADKPGGTGGIDTADQDFNNGCGNDDDFEDDNNGNCGGIGETGNGGVSTTRARPAVLGAEADAAAAVAGRAAVRAAPRAAETAARSAMAGNAAQPSGGGIVGPTTGALAMTGSMALLLFASAAGALALGGAMRGGGRPRF